MLYLPYEKESKISTFLVLDSMACPPAAVTAPRNWGISAALILSNPKIGMPQKFHGNMQNVIKMPSMA